MRKRNLIVCPKCKENKITQVLGEIDDWGHFLVMRFHQGITRIVGGSFAVVCGKCGELVYIKKGKDEGKVSDNWLIGISRFEVKTAYLAGKGSEKAREKRTSQSERTDSSL